MSDNNKPRNIIHELANVPQILGNDYTLTNVECDPGDSAARITKRNSTKTLYIIASSNPANTETYLYDGPDSLAAYHIFPDRTFNDLTPADIADHITKKL